MSQPEPTVNSLEANEAKIAGLVEALRDALEFAEKHKAALIGNECTSSEYAAAISSGFRALASVKGDPDASQ